MKLSTITALAFATLTAGERFLKTRKDESLEFNPESMILNYGKLDKFLSGEKEYSVKPRSFDQSIDSASFFEFLKKLFVHPGFQEDGPDFDKRSLDYDNIGDTIEDSKDDVTNEEPASAEIFAGPPNEFGALRIVGSHESVEEHQNEFGELQNPDFSADASSEAPSSLESLIAAYLSRVSPAEIEEFLQECLKLESAFFAERIKFDEIYCPASFNPVAKTKLLANEELLAKANEFERKLQSRKLEVGQVFCPPEITF